MKGRILLLLMAVAIILQAAGVGIWWEWFNHYAFASSSLGGGIFKVLLLGSGLAAWAYAWKTAGSKYFAWDSFTFLRRDVLAGLPLILLPALIPLAPPLAELAKPFAMKLTAFAWLPWWRRGQSLPPQAYVMLMAGGVFILTAIFAKLGLLLQGIMATAPERINVKRLWLVGFLVYLVVLSWPACMSAPQSGEISHLLVTQALSYDTTFHIERVLFRADYYQYHPVQEITFQGYSDAFGQLYLTVAPGMPLIFMTFYLIQGRWLVSVLVMLFAAAAAAQLYGFCREQGFSAPASKWVWLIALINSPLLLYGYQAYEVSAGAFFIIWGLRMAFKAGQISTGNTTALAASAGLAAGLLWLGGLRFVFPACLIIVLLTYFLLRVKRGQELVAAIASFIIPFFSALTFYFTIYWFFLDHMPYHFNYPWQLGMWVNALGVLTDRYAGLLWNAPVWLIGLAGTFWLWSKQRLELSAAILLSLLIAWLFAMVFPDPRAEGSSLHRFLAPLLPLLGLGLAAFIEQVKMQGWGFRLVQATGLWGLSLAGLQIVFPFLSQEAVRVKLFQLLRPLGLIYNWLPSFPDYINWGSIMLSLILCLGIAAGVYWLMVFMRQQES